MPIKTKNTNKSSKLSKPKVIGENISKYEGMLPDHHAKHLENPDMRAWFQELVSYISTLSDSETEKVTKLLKILKKKPNKKQKLLLTNS